ncbi:MAG TPA: formate dehydrogenase accessory sulfurtransferase FdhD [Candidatus Binataceae bacterium]|nr:formate dehydrogenase accessory sulfurtransferase FdhD [Candidatus Binataceae bacterium]
MAEAASESVRSHPALKWRDGVASGGPDQLAVEEPLEIRLAGRRFTLTMRTPGNDEELAAGFLLAEGFISSREELGEIRRVRGRNGAPEANVIDIVLSVPAAALRERLKRNFMVSSSCGMCGKSGIEAIQRRLEPLPEGPRIAARTLLRLPMTMREGQQVFTATGGLHAAALFEIGAAGESARMIVLREDVGRHNAVDKAVGYALMHRMVPLANAIMLVSGRLSFEIVQKAAAAGVPILCAVSAPSSLAVELAEEVGMTLVGFLRASNFNIYTGQERILE